MELALKMLAGPLIGASVGALVGLLVGLVLRRKAVAEQARAMVMAAAKAKPTRYLDINDSTCAAWREAARWC